MRFSILSTKKFKSGDRVRLDNGHTGTIDRYCGVVNADNIYSVIFPGSLAPTVAEKYLTLVEEVSMDRESILKNALEIVTKDRNQAYGDPEDNFRDIAGMWSIYKGVKFEAHDVAVMMILLKQCRIKISPDKADHWEDTAGYAACGGQAYDKEH